jgi:hypothetical protein
MSFALEEIDPDMIAKYVSGGKTGTGDTQRADSEAPFAFLGRLTPVTNSEQQRDIHKDDGRAESGLLDRCSPRNLPPDKALHVFGFRNRLR